MKSSWIKVLVLSGVLTLATSASAQEDYIGFNDPWRIYVGGFWPQTDSTIGINDDTGGIIPPVSVEDILRVEDSKAVAFGGVSWHFANRHSVEFEYFSLKRDGGTSGTFTPPIEIGDVIIEAGAIDTFYDTNLGRLTYGFSAVRNERMDFQLKAGLHIIDLAAGLQLTGQICDPTTKPSEPPNCPPLGTGVQSESVTAPLPHFGLSFAYAMTRTLSINLQVIGFAIELDSLDGSILELDADLGWQPWQHVGFGVGLRYFNSNVQSTGSDLNGEFDLEYFGPTFYVNASF